MSISIYLAHPISNEYEAEASIKMANELRNLGFAVYAAAENKVINDKTSNEPPTPEMIYEHDMDAIINSDIMVVNLTGGHQDGTIVEIGFLAGLNTMRERDNERPTPIFAYSTNMRLASPQFSDGIPSAGANHLVKGAIDKWGTFIKGGSDGLLKAIKGTGL